MTSSSFEDEIDKFTKRVDELDKNDPIMRLIHVIAEVEQKKKAKAKKKCWFVCDEGRTTIT